MGQAELGVDYWDHVRPHAHAHAALLHASLLHAQAHAARRGKGSGRYGWEWPLWQEEARSTVVLACSVNMIPQSRTAACECLRAACPCTSSHLYQGGEKHADSWHGPHLPHPFAPTKDRPSCGVLLMLSTRGTGSLVHAHAHPMQDTCNTLARCTQLAALLEGAAAFLSCPCPPRDRHICLAAIRCASRDGYKLFAAS